MLTLLDLNNIQLEATNLELEQIILDVAAGTIDYKAFHAWVLAHI
jgi:prophage maintenance system killer protein